MENNIKEVIKTRLNTLIALNETKQKDLAAVLGVKDNVISYFCSGARTPNVEQLNLLSDYFNVSLDYLVGRSDIKTPNADIRAVCEYTGLSEETVKKYNKIKNKIAHRYLIMFLNNLLKDNYVDEISEKLENVYHYYDSFTDLLSEQTKKMEISKNSLDVTLFIDEYKQRYDLSNYSKQLTVEIIKKVIDDLFSDLGDKMKHNLKCVNELEKSEDIDVFLKNISSLYNITIENNQICYI